jgi:rhodanese-related sulfurtransferase
MDITVKELKERLDRGEKLNILDVREVPEFNAGKISNFNIPMGEIPHQLARLTEFKDQELILYCRSGGRSGAMTQYLKSQGFKNVRNLIGGVLAWKAEIDPSFVIG